MSPTDFKDQLTGHLRDLHLPAVRRCFEETARQAERETLSYERYLFELIERECQERRQHRIARLLQESKLPLEKTLESFNLQRLPLHWFGAGAACGEEKAAAAPRHSQAGLLRSADPRRSGLRTAQPRGNG